MHPLKNDPLPPPPRSVCYFDMVPHNLIGPSNLSQNRKWQLRLILALGCPFIAFIVKLFIQKIPTWPQHFFYVMDNVLEFLVLRRSSRCDEAKFTCIRCDPQTHRGSTKDSHLFWNILYVRAQFCPREQTNPKWEIEPRGTSYLIVCRAIIFSR